MANLEVQDWRDVLISQLQKEIRGKRMDVVLAERKTRKIKRDLAFFQTDLKWSIEDLRTQIENVQYFIETAESDDDLAQARNLTKVLLASLDRHGRRISNFVEDSDV